MSNLRVLKTRDVKTRAVKKKKKIRKFQDEFKSKKLLLLQGIVWPLGGALVRVTNSDG